MNLMNLYNKLDEFAHYIFRVNYVKKSVKHYKKMYSMNGIKIKKLSREQRQAVREFWKIRGKMDYSTHQLYYSVTGIFDERICSEMIYRTKIDPMLNDRRMNFAWDDKNFFDRFLPEVEFPYTIVRNIHGTFMNHEYEPLSQKAAHDLICENLPLIIKPSISSGLSRGILLLDNADAVAEIMNNFKSNYIVQRLIRQCDEFKQFSPRSVNIMRLITVIINGEPQFMSGNLRANTENAIADNRITKDGRGMVVIGIDSDGKLKRTGYYSCGERIQQLPNGLVFEGIEIPAYKEACQLVLNAHKKMPMFRAIGWDVTIDENYKPIVMEYNLKGMGIYYYQLANGPLFGEHTDEVVRMLQES